MMQRVGIFLSLIFLLSACQIEQSSSSDAPFDKEKWAQKKGKDYPFRNAMLEDVLYNDTIRQRRLGLWVLNG